MLPTTAATQVAELVRALALGWKNLAAYPPGHPALISSLGLIDRRLAGLRGPAGEVVLGIASDGLLYGADKIDSMPAQKFAQALYARGVAVLRFANETDPGDIETFLRLLAASAPGDAKRAIWEDLTAAGVTHIDLQPVDYSAMQITDDLSTPPSTGPSLWEEILRALIEGRQFSAEAEFLSGDPRSPDELTKMILQYVDSTVGAKPAFDPNATFGVRMPVHVETAEAIHRRVGNAVARFVAEATGWKKQNAVEQAVQLLRTLPQPMRGTVLRKIAEALATDDTAEPLLRQLASELPRDEMLEALRYLSSMEAVSEHAAGLLQSLAAMEQSTRAEPPSASVVGDLVRLFGENDIDQFNPPDHAALLEQVSVHIPHIPAQAATTGGLGNRVETVTDDALARQLTRTLIDLLMNLGPARPPRALLSRLEGLFRSCLAAGELEEALELINHLKAVATTTDAGELRHEIDAAIGRMATGETIHALIESLHHSPPEKARLIQRLTEALGGSARRSLLLALSEENHRGRRRRLFDFISSLGPVIVPDVKGCLTDSRWYVLRNMIILLRVVNDRTSLPEIQKLAEHPDLRVRMEAIKSLFALDTDVSPELLANLIHDRDPKVAESAITLIGTYGIREGVQPLLSILEGIDFWGARRARRIKAIRALGDLGDPECLPALQRFFGNSILPWPSKDERYAAWESLAGYSPEARGDLLEKGLRSRHSFVRELCERMGQA